MIDRGFGGLDPFGRRGRCRRQARGAITSAPYLRRRCRCIPQNEKKMDIIGGNAWTILTGGAAGAGRERRSLKLIRAREDFAVRQTPYGWTLESRSQRLSDRSRSVAKV